MVKGNWERRAEMALLRRKEAKEKKANRSRPKAVSNEAAWSKLHGDEALQQSGAIVSIWLEDLSDDTPTVCSAWFRCEECNVKKCRLSHDGVTVAYLKNIATDVFESDDGGANELIRQERTCLPAKPLREVSAREAIHIMIIAVDNRCVFDYRDPSAWTQWQSSRSAECAGAKSRALSTVSEEDAQNSDGDSNSDGEDDGEGGDDVDEDVLKVASKIDSSLLISSGAASSSCKRAANSNIKGSRIHSSMFCMFTTAETGLVHSSSEAIATCLIAHLDMTDLAALLQTAKALKAYCQRNELFRRRKREGISEVAHELSRRRKEEKKRRVKSANAKKTDKKDAFARGGGNGGR